MKKNIILIIYILIFFLFALITGAWIIPVSSSASIINEESQLWRHRVNNPVMASSSLLKFKGFETDVVFEEDAKYFDIRHEPEEEASRLSLEEIFKAISNDACFVWVDIKNLTIKNAPGVIVHLNQLEKIYKIRNRVIIESPNANALNEISKAGYFTSYWVPHYEKSPINYLKFYALTRINLFKYNFTALSAHAHMLPFLQFFYPKVNLHLWTHGSDRESELAMVNDLIKNKNVKIILVDFEHDI